MTLSIFFGIFKVHKILVYFIQEIKYDIGGLLGCWLYV